MATASLTMIQNLKDIKKKKSEYINVHNTGQNYKNKVNTDIPFKLAALAAVATCFYTFDGFIDAVYFTLRLHAVSKQTARQDE